jgi:hypothetical protein
LQRGSRTALDQPVRCLPLSERPGIRERGTVADHAAGRVDVSPGVEQRVQHLDVIAARRPVQRRLGMWPAEARVDVGSGLDQGDHGRRAVGEMPRPVRRDMQQRARHPIGIIVA